MWTETPHPTAWQIAPGANFVHLKVFADGDPYASFASIEAALDWSMANKNLNNIAAVNMSLGTGYAWQTTYTGLSDEFETLHVWGL